MSAAEPPSGLGSAALAGEGDAPAAAGSGSANGGDGTSPAPQRFAGSFSTRYRHRSGEDQDDDDVYGVLDLALGDEEVDPLTGYVSGRLSKDLDGDRSPDSAFFGLDDSYDSSWNGRLYEAWVAVQDTSLETLRIGRQWLTETPELLTLDGLLVESRDKAVLGSQLGAYAGRPHQDYESSSGGDGLWGLYARSRPWSGARMRLDWMHVTDDLGQDTERNDLFGISLWQSVLRQLELRGKYTRLDGDSREAELAATWYDAERDVLVQGAWRQLLQEQRRQVQVLDEFTSVLQSYAPYRQRRLLASKGLGPDFDLEAGFDRRELEDDDDDSAFNREFDRWWLTGTWSDLGIDGLSLALTGEIWDSDGSDQSTWGLDLTRRLSQALRVSLGSAYSLFKDDFLLEEEREHVRTYYGRVRYLLDAVRTLSVGFEYEDADVGVFRTLTAKLTWRI